MSLGLIVFSGLSSSGCSVIGLVVGLDRDSGSPDTTALKPLLAGDLRQRAAVQILSCDSSLVVGEFVGLDTDPDTSFPRLYHSWRSQGIHTSLFPSIGDTVKIKTIESVGRRTQEVAFAGFDVGEICYQDDRWVTRIPLRKVVSMTSRDGTGLFGPSDLMNDEDTLSPPLRSSLLIRRDRDTLHIPLASVRQIRTPSVKNDALTFFLVGACIDGVVYLVLHEIYEDFLKGPWTFDKHQR
jgi:hypothetical protein